MRRLSIQTESSLEVVSSAVMSLLVCHLEERKEPAFLPPSAPFPLTRVVIRLTESKRFLIRTLKFIIDANAVV